MDNAERAQRKLEQAKKRMWLLLIHSGGQDTKFCHHMSKEGCRHRQ